MHYSELIPGRAQYVLLKVRDIQFGCLNVYAPNRVSERIEFWSQLYDVLPIVDNWCIGRDFNMLENFNDRAGGGQTLIHGHELACWERVCFKLELSMLGTLQHS